MEWLVGLTLLAGAYWFLHSTKQTAAKHSTQERCWRTGHVFTQGGAVYGERCARCEAKPGDRWYDPKGVKR